MRIDGSRILVTGGCGLIGSTTIDLLLNEYNPSEIVVLDNLSRGSMDNLAEAMKDPRVRLIEGDIRDSGLVQHLTEGMDAVVHMAALRITACAAAPRNAFETMCLGTYNVVEAAHRAGVKKIVAASTASIYGMAKCFPTTEEHHPYGNRTWYGAAKIMLEGLLRSFNDMYGLEYVIFRYFNVYGPRMDTDGKYTEVLIRWMERIDAGLPPIIFGDGEQTMDFVYITDVARANVLGLASDVSDEVFNVASGIETSLKQLAEALIKTMNTNVHLEYGAERKVNPVSRRLADTSKAKAMLGFETKIGLDEGLAQLVQWWRAENKRKNKKT